MSQASLLSAAVRPFKALFVSDAREGILLIFVAIAAILVANSALSHAYHDAFHGTLPWTPIAKLNTLHLWINDGLMAIFFFVVGLEVKRELIAGNLSDPKQRTLPILAAIAGMAVPAAVYFAIAGGEPNLSRGWAIPAATDIAFAMGVIGLLGTRVPPSLRLFLLTVAIVDDIGAVMIIAIFYTAKIKVTWLIASMLAFAAMIAMNRMGVKRMLPFIVAALALWFCVLNSGIHATIAGVVAALTIPMRSSDGHSMLETMEHALVGWNAYFVVPVFGFANAGVDVRELGMEGLIAPLPLAIAAGLVVGKQVGILGSVVLAKALGIAKPPPGATWTQVWGTAVLCGIGFTMSLFIGALAFPGYPELVEEAKLGVLTGSLISALLGYAILRFAKPPKPVAPNI